MPLCVAWISSTHRVSDEDSGARAVLPIIFDPILYRFRPSKNSGASRSNGTGCHYGGTYRAFVSSYSWCGTRLWPINTGILAAVVSAAPEPAGTFHVLGPKNIAAPRPGP